jgi:hypothetical protein
VVESHCPTCAALVLPGQVFCAICGASLAGLTGPAPEREDESAAELGPEAGPEEGPLLVTAEPDAEPAPHIPGGYVAPTPGLEPSSWVMNPSDSSSSPRRPGSSIGLQVGARPMTLGGDAVPSQPEPAAPAPGPAAPAAQLPYAPPAPPREQLPSFVVPGQTVPRSPFAAPVPSAVPTPAVVAPPPVAAGPESAPPGKESIPELVAFGLVAAGAFIGIASLFLPWSGVTGIGIGTMSVAGSPPPPNQWGWAMPASLLLFVISVPILLAAAASDRAQERFPRFDSIIARVTDLVLPMILGGLYLGVILMYLTVPADYGPGLYVGQYALALAAGLLIAGAVVTVFLPPPMEDRPG